jgi:hypothetical protein
MNTRNTQYGDVVQFQENEMLQFPDFQICYTGKTQQKFAYYNFRITVLEGGERTLRWTSGTGDIAPVNFVIKDKVYLLSLKRSGKENVPLAENEMVISLSEESIADYLFHLIAQLSPVSEHTLDTLANVLGLPFTTSENANAYFDIFSSPGFSPFIQVELRMHKSDPSQKLLILGIHPNADISESAVLARYPSAETVIHAPDDLNHISLIAQESWGSIGFSFDHDGILTTAVIDSTENKALS